MFCKRMNGQTRARDGEMTVCGEGKRKPQHWELCVAPSRIPQCVAARLGTKLLRLPRTCDVERLHDKLAFR